MFYLTHALIKKGLLLELSQADLLSLIARKFGLKPGYELLGFLLFPKREPSHAPSRVNPLQESVSQEFVNLLLMR